MKRLFAISSIVFLVVLAISPAKNALRPYRSIQREFRRVGASRAKSSKTASDYQARPVAIQQIWLRGFDDRVDRCTTCHLGAADPSMGGAPEPYRLHPQTAHTPSGFDRFGCTSCHGGQGLATSTDEAHGTTADAGPPMLPLAYIEAGCGRCHTGGNVPEAAILSRGRELLASSGCYACHAVRGQNQFRSDAPPLASIPAKTGGGALRRWLKNPREADPNARMPNFHLAADEIEQLGAYLFGQNVPADLAARIDAASAEPAGNPANGKKLFSESRCISCHTVEGKGNGSAPELSHVASKVTRGWLLAFLRDPHAFNPRTRMPRYGLDEIQTRDLVAYFEDEMKDFEAPADILEPLHVNRTLAEKGEKLFRRYGCFACHGMVGTPASEKFGPDLDGIGEKRAFSLDFGRRTDLPRALPAWLAAKIAGPRSFAPGLKMPSFGFSSDDSRAVVTALLSLSSAPVPEAYRSEPLRPPSLVPGGEIGELISRYRCLSCHQIGAQGGDTSTAPLTFEGSKVRREWLIDYLILSYSIRPIIPERMPVFRMSRENATKLADALTSFYVDPSIPDDPFAGRPASDSDAKEGERLYVSFGCRSCHIIGNSGGYVGPPLSDTANRLRPGWINHWLSNPQQWRRDALCPNYGLTPTDALRLTSYLETLRAPAGGAK